MANSASQVNHLTPNTLSQHNGENNDANYFRNAGKTESMLSEVSVMTNDSDDGNKKEGRFWWLRDIVQTENDLAGFSLVWAIGFVVILILKLVEHEDAMEAKWSGLFVIPIAICCLTWIFSYVITKYRKFNFVESMKIPAFILPFIFKIAIALILFGRLFYAKGGITDRFNTDKKYNGWCDASMIVIWICLLLAIVTTEIIITTVMVNSSQNLQKEIPKKVDFFLFLTRPTLWVYNRLIVVFITFYAFYFVFGLGPLCTSQCKVPEVKDLQSIGVMFFTLPFKNIFYLFEWKQFDLTQYTQSRDKVFAVIQQILIFTTIIDILMDIWSVSQIFKRIELADVKKFAEVASMRGFGKNKMTQMTPMPAINEEKNSNKLTTLKPAGMETGDVYSPTDDDMNHELELLNSMGNKNKDKEMEEKEEEEKQEEEEDKVAANVMHEVMDKSHKIQDTVDDILENYNLNDMNVSETSEEQDIEPRDDELPGYSMLQSESKSKLSKRISDKTLAAARDVKPVLETINSENNGGDTQL